MASFRIGVLQCGSVSEALQPEFGDYPDMFARLLGAVDPTVMLETYDLTAGRFPDDPGSCDAWLFTGSQWSVYDDAPWIGRALELGRQLDEARRPTVGVCFGHQLLAQALGGQVRRSPRGWGVGVHTCRLLDGSRPAWREPELPAFSLLVSHQDQVETLPPGATHVAGHDFCPYDMFRMGSHILTVQGHPEFTAPYARALMTSRRGALGEETYRRGMASLSEPTDERTVATWLLAFLHGR